MKRFLKKMCAFGLLPAAIVYGASLVQAVAIENYLLVIPFIPANNAAQKSGWFSNAVRDSFSEAALSLDTVVFLKEDELKSLKKEYSISFTTMDHEKMETIADKHDIALCYGSYKINKDIITVTCNLIASHNTETQVFEKKGNKNQLQKLFNNLIMEVVKSLGLNYDREALNLIRTLPGTNYWPTLKMYNQAMDYLRSNPKNRQACGKAIPYLSRVIKSDKRFISARALRVSCRLAGIPGRKSAVRRKKWL